MYESYLGILKYLGGRIVDRLTETRDDGPDSSGDLRNMFSDHELMRTTLKHTPADTTNPSSQPIILDLITRTYNLSRIAIHATP